MPLPTIRTIGVSRIFSGRYKSSPPQKKKPDDLLVIALKSQYTCYKTAKLTTSNPCNSPPPSKNFLKHFTSCSAWGCTYNYPYKLRPNFSSPPRGMHMHPVHPLATPIITTATSIPQFRPVFDFILLYFNFFMFDFWTQSTQLNVGRYCIVYTSGVIILRQELVTQRQRKP